MFNIGPGEMVMLAILALLIFGPQRLPEMGRALGQGMRAFRQATNSLKEEIRALEQEAEEKPVAKKDEGGEDKPEPEPEGAVAMDEQPAEEEAATEDSAAEEPSRPGEEASCR
ncbi:MAG: twin-arginine translocase TatA/TatE family subunit [Armatimonadetes bacterium]|nr:twin-arginine translocase TatA/TatE family subunit [Armatimonadota bacterium]